MLYPIFLIVCFVLRAHCGILAPADVLVEYMRRPTIEIAKPRFFWLPTHSERDITQSAYQIKVYAVLTGVAMWDSGKVASGISSHVEYGGLALTSNTVYNVSVVWWDSTDAASPPGIGEFSTGLLTQGEWSPAAWIGCPLHSGTTPNYNQLRTEFTLGLAQGVSISQARLYLAAVGYAAPRVNGVPAPHYTHGDGVRNDPGWTTYELRSWYSTYDITSLLSASAPNALAIWQANGWPDIGPVPGNSSSLSLGLGDNVGENRATRALLLITDSTGAVHTISTTAPSFASSSAAASSSDWWCGTGSLIYDNIYNGVTWDARNYTTGWDLPGFSSKLTPPQWTPSVLRADPGGALPTVMASQAFPAVKVQFELHAQTLTEPSPGVFVFDFGQNIAGYSRLSLPAPTLPGITITLRHAELLQHPPYGPSDGNVYTGNLRSARATDVYTTAGVSEGYETWEPVIGTYHGFRFVELTGLDFPPSLDTVTAVFIRSDVDAAGFVNFAPGPSDLLNKLQHAVSWGIGNNLMSVVSDCPQRDERKGWMGDSGLSLQPTHYGYKMGAFYTAWAENIRDAQLNPRDGHPAGSVPDTVPHTFGSYPSDPAWGTAYPGVVYSTWRMLGDTRLAGDHYPNLVSYVNFMMSEVNKTGIGKLYQSYGDWCPPGPAPPKSYTSGIALLQDLERMVELAAALGRSSDSATFAATRASLVQDFNTAWYHADSGVYGDAAGAGLQTANAAALALNFPDSPSNVASAQAALAKDVSVTHTSHWSTGIIGMRFLHSSLTQAGNGSLALDTLLQSDYPSFGYWFSGVDETAATTMWELPDAPSQGPGMVRPWFSTNNFYPTNTPTHTHAHTHTHPRGGFRTPEIITCLPVWVVGCMRTWLALGRREVLKQIMTPLHLTPWPSGTLSFSLESQTTPMSPPLPPFMNL